MGIGPMGIRPMGIRPMSSAKAIWEREVRPMLRGNWHWVLGAVALLVIAVLPSAPTPKTLDDYPRATDLSEARGCAVGYAALRERGIAARTGCTYVPSAGGGSIAVDHADGFTRYSFVVHTVGNQLHVQVWRPEQRGLMPKSLGVVAFARD